MTRIDEVTKLASKLLQNQRPLIETIERRFGEVGVLKGARELPDGPELFWLGDFLLMVRQKTYYDPQTLKPDLYGNRMSIHVLSKHSDLRSEVRVLYRRHRKRPCMCCSLETLWELYGRIRRGLRGASKKEWLAKVDAAFVEALNPVTYSL